MFVAGVIQLAFQLPPLLKLRLARHGRAGGQRTKACSRIGQLMLPAIIGSSMGQISVLISSSIATLLATGSVAWLYYADRLVEFPLGVFSIALATVILPSLSAHHAAGVAGALCRDARLGACACSLLLVVPAAVGTARARRAADRHHLPLRRFTDFDAHMTTLRAHGLFVRLARQESGESARPRLLRAAGHAHARALGLIALGVTMALNLWCSGRRRLDMGFPGSACTARAIHLDVGALLNACASVARSA